MKRHVFPVVAAALTLCCNAVAQTVQPQWPQVERHTKAGSRWWLMGSALDEQSVTHRLAEYGAAGIGTLEMTPIYGVQGNEKNNINYLSTPWMDMLKHVQTTAEANDIDIEMSTGTGWPFGGPSVTISQAAGKLEYSNSTIEGDGATAQTVSIALNSSSGSPSLNRVMAYPQTGNDGEVTDVTSLVEGSQLKWTAPAGKWLIIAVYNSHTGQQVKRAAPGGAGYVLDHFDSTAVANYLKVFDNAFERNGSPWPKAFFNDSYEVFNADWTPKMFEEFYKYRGYKLEENMDRLLGLGTRKDVNNQVLADYRETLGDMLLNNFTRQWTAWAHSHGATTRNQGHGSPANLIDIYAAVDVPEIEGFGLTDFCIRGLRTDPGFTRANYSDFATLKWASSAAHITGKPLTSSETFTWLTEHFRTSLSQMKPDMDLMFCAGVNHMLFHGTTFTPDGAAWPGWKFYAAVDMSPTNSIWRDAPQLMKYMERCQSFLQMGTPDNDLLVYVPVYAAYHQKTGTLFKDRMLTFPIDNVSQKLPDLTNAVKSIEAAGLDCDYISDQYLLTTTFVDGMLQTAAGTRYHGLVVPSKNYIPEATLQHLEQLENAGARIVYAYDRASILSLGATPEAIRTDMGLRMIRRKNETGHHYFVSNLSPETVSGYVPLSVEFADAYLFDPLTGGIRRASIEGNYIYVSLRSGESVIVQTYNAPLQTSSAGQSAISEELPAYTIGGEWKLSFVECEPAIGSTFTLNNGPQTWEQLSDEAGRLMGTGVYETTFTLTAQQMSEATAGFRLDLGDVRESARVYINNVSVGCAWAAPFVLDVPGSALHEGENALRIEVTNLPANRIRQMDADGVVWRIFEDVNILDIANGSIGVSGITSYAGWDKMPSGLNSEVRLIPLRAITNVVDVELKGMLQDGEVYYPQYKLATFGGRRLTGLTATDAAGNAFTGYDVTATDEGCLLLTVKGLAAGKVRLNISSEDGTRYESDIIAGGAYVKGNTYDFTADEAPSGGWSGAFQRSITGFDVKTACHIGLKTGKEISDLYDGLTFTAANTINCYIFPEYGLQTNTASSVTPQTEHGGIGELTFVVGNDLSTATYDIEKAQTTYTIGASASDFSISLHPSSDYYVYRSLTVYQQQQSASGITAPRALRGSAGGGSYYTLQGVRTLQPTRGLYIHNGKKVVVK